MGVRTGQQTEAVSRFSEYRAWLKLRWAEWRLINDVPPTEPLTYAHYQAFDSWLALCSARSQLDPARAQAASSAG
jgi:hypothetical protein